MSPRSRPEGAALVHGETKIRRCKSSWAPTGYRSDKEAQWGLDMTSQDDEVAQGVWNRKRKVGGECAFFFRLMRYWVKDRA